MSEKRGFKLAMVQMRVMPGEKKANLARAVGLVEEAAARGAQVVVLPEAMDLGWTHSTARADAEPIPGGSPCDALMAAAKRHGVYICAGLTERDRESTYNSAVLLAPEGRLLLNHRKLNELEIAHDCYAQGDRLGVAHTPLGTFGIMICADAFVRGQVVTRTLGMMGADVILSPCAWAVSANHDNAKEPYGKLWIDSYGPVARDFALWIAGVSNVGPITAGPWAGRKCIGCSMLVDPRGEPVVRGPYGEDAETVLYAEVAPVPRPARGCGWEKYWNKRR